MEILLYQQTFFLFLNLATLILSETNVLRTIVSFLYFYLID